MLDAYERGRYGTVAPSDRRKPCVDAAALLRASYEGTHVQVRWGEALLSLLVGAKRDGVSVSMIISNAAEVAAAWVADGNESHPNLSGQTPPTSEHYDPPLFDV